MFVSQFLDEWGVRQTIATYKYNNNKKTIVPRGTITIGKDKPNYEEVWNKNVQIYNRYRKYGISIDEGLKLTLAMETKTINVLDIDDKDLLDHPYIQKLMEIYPFYMSVEKKLPKIFICFINMPPNDFSNNNLQVIREKLEIQQGQWSFFNEDAELLNADNITDLSHLELDYNTFRKELDLTSPLPTNPLKDIPTNPLKDIHTNPLKDINTNPLKDYSKNELKDMLEKLPSIYYESYDKWFIVGCSLKPFDFGRDLFHWFSKKSGKYNFFDCDKQFDNCPIGNIGTIINLIKDKYDIQQKFFEELLKDFNHMNIVDFIESYTFLERYKFCINTKKWYVCNNDTNVWCQTEPNCLYKQIRNIIKPLIEARIIQLQRNDDDKIKHKDFVKQLKSNIKSLGTTSYIKQVLLLLQPILSDKNIFQKLDSNPNLLAFNNGVLDFTQDIFRDIKPNDYIQNYIDYDLPLTKNVNLNETSILLDSKTSTITDFFDSLFVKNEIKEHLLDVICSCMYGDNFRQKFIIFTGEGSNGKSVLKGLLEGTFKTYISEMNAASLCHDKSSANEHSDFVKTKSSKVLCIGEPDCHQTFKSNIIKKITGCDVLVERPPYGANSIQFCPYFTPFVFCNNIPKLSVYDTAIERRLEVIDFPMQFKDQQELQNIRDMYEDDLETMEKEMVIYKTKKDITFRNDESGKLFIMFLIHRYYTRVKNLVWVVPDDILKKNKSYLNDNDVIEWINLNYEVGTEKVKRGDLYDRFKNDNIRTKTRKQEFFKILERGGFRCVKIKGDFYFKLKDKSWSSTDYNEDGAEQTQRLLEN